MGEVVDHSCNKQTSGNGKLICTYEGASNPLGSHLRLIQGDKYRNNANSEASQKSAQWLVLMFFTNSIERRTCLPDKKSGMSVEAVWSETPNANIPIAIIRDGRRPSRSPAGAATRAPKNVPALKIDTIREDCEVVRLGR